MEHMTTPVGAELSSLSVAEVEKLLRPLFTVNRIGGTMLWSGGTEYHVLKYSIDVQVSNGRHEMELLAMPTKDDSQKWRVVNVRFIYQVLNGPAYYNYLIPIDWPYLRSKKSSK